MRPRDEICYSPPDREVRIQGAEEDIFLDAANVGFFLFLDDAYLLQGILFSFLFSHWGREGDRERKK